MDNDTDKNKKFPINIRGSGFNSRDEAEDFARTVARYAAIIGRKVDLTTLESITIATEVEYRNALLELDRGMETRAPLRPTNEEYATGVAMTPSVVRDGKVKSVMFLRTEAVLSLADPESEYFAQALHLICHECSHVEVTATFSACFPDFVLSPMKGIIEGLKWRTILACWDEFAVCCICANMEPRDELLKGYNDTFRQVLQRTKPNLINTTRAGI